jgi:hypothetical protein
MPELRGETPPLGGVRMVGGHGFFDFRYFLMDSRTLA